MSEQSHGQDADFIAGGFARRRQHSNAPGCVHGQEANTQLAGGAYSSGHRVRDVVEL